LSYSPKGGHGYGNSKHRSAKSFQASRSKRSQSMDARKSAPIADSEQQWMKDPSHFDIEGIDTPESGQISEPLISNHYASWRTPKLQIELASTKELLEKSTTEHYPNAGKSALALSRSRYEQEISQMTDVLKKRGIPVIAKETPEAFFYGNFPQNQFFIVRRWDDGDTVQFAHHFPRGDGQFPEGYPSLKAAQAYIQEWEGINLKGESMRGSKIVDAKEAANYPVPKRY
jgi:hypothetical protein